MAENHQLVLVDKDLRPAYYDDFHCIMGACQLNCCDDGWEITFDKKDYLKVKQAPKGPELEEMMRKSLHRLRGREDADIYAEFRPDDEGRCAFHTPEGLCRLQLECSEKTLPKVCREFPRVDHYMPSGYLERSLSPACEGVLALLWDLPEGIDFRSDPLPPERKTRGVRPEDSRRFSEIREWCVDVLQNRRFPLPQRIFLMGLGLRELADGETDIGRWRERAEALAENTDLSGVLPTGERELLMYLSNCNHIHLGIKNVIQQTLTLRRGSELLYSGDREAARIMPVYREALARFEERFGGREYFWENLMVTAFFHCHMPYTGSWDELWKGYVSFCNLYAFYRFVSVMSCREGAPGDRDELFRLIVFASRKLVHNVRRQDRLRNEFFQNDSATLAHMAILLCG